LSRYRCPSTVSLLTTQHGGVLLAPNFFATTMEGRISRLDHHDRRFSAPPECSQMSEVRWSTYSTSESQFPVQTGTSASKTHRGAPPLRSALKRPMEFRNSLASSSSTSGTSSSSTDGRGPDSVYLERSFSCYSFPNRASIWNSEKPNRPDGRIELFDTSLQQDTKKSAPVDPSLLVLNGSSIRTPIPNPPRKQNVVSSLISRLRIGRQPAGSAPTPTPSHDVARRSQPPLLSHYRNCDIPDDIPTIDIRVCTPSDSDPDTPPLPNPVGDPEPPIRKTVRFAIWSHMRIFERPEWEPTGCVCKEVPYSGSSYRGLLRKVWVV